MKKIISLVFAALVCLSVFAQDSLRVSVLGDSYSTFSGNVFPAVNHIWYPHDRNDVKEVEQTWWSIFVADMGYTLEVNNSYSGSTVGFTGYKDKNGNHNDYTDFSFITRSSNLGNPDLILIFGGTNDSWCGAPVGEYKWKKWTREDLFFFRPAMAKMCSEIKTLYPGARVIFMLNDQLREDINESVHTVCKHYKIECLDLQNIDKQVGHPSQQGMNDIAKQLEAIL